MLDTSQIFEIKSNFRFNFILLCMTPGSWVLMYLSDTCELSLQDKDMPSTLKSIYQALNKGTHVEGFRPYRKTDYLIST